ncbi:MAG: PIG-L family deacetylase, partial [Limisphaerales bacterium]
MRSAPFLSILLLAISTSRLPSAESPPQGAGLLKTDILGVFAHPDDETGMAATLARYAHGEGKVIAHAYITRGEGGGNMVGTQAGPALGVLREAELRDCLRVLGVRYCYVLEQEDFFYTESLAASHRKWRKEEALAKLVRLVRSLR